MVLAAGLGTRLKPFTLRSPKALVPLLGVPTIEFSLLQLRAAGVGSAVVNVHSHADQMIRFLSKDDRGAMTIAVSDESAKLLGSAGGFRKALPLLETSPGKSEVFFSLNADVVCDVNLEQLAQKHEELRKKHGVLLTLCLARGKTLAGLEGSYTEILCDENEGLITGFGAPKNGVPFYTGVGVFETDAFRHLPEGAPSEFVPEVLAPLIQKRKVGFFWTEGLWLDVGSPTLWLKAHFQLQQALKANALPESWKTAIEEGMKTGFFSETDRVVDYGLKASGATTGKNYIAWQGDRVDV